MSFPPASWTELKEEWLKPIGGAFLLPFFLYREVKEQVDLWKTRPHTPVSGKENQANELKTLIARLERYRDEAPSRQERLRESVIAKLFTDPSTGIALASRTLLTDIIWYEGLLRVPDIDLTDARPSTGKIWEMEDALSRVVDSFEKTQALQGRLEKLVSAILDGSDLAGRKGKREGDTMFSVPLYALARSRPFSRARSVGNCNRAMG
jgi:hypothetical protein